MQNLEMLDMSAQSKKQMDLLLAQLNGGWKEEDTKLASPQASSNRFLSQR